MTLVLQVNTDWSWRWYKMFQNFPWGRGYLLGNLSWQLSWLSRWVVLFVKFLVLAIGHPQGHEDYVVRPKWRLIKWKFKKPAHITKTKGDFILPSPFFFTTRLSKIVRVYPYIRTLISMNVRNAGNSKNQPNRIELRGLLGHLACFWELLAGVGKPPHAGSNWIWDPFSTLNCS